MSEKVWFAKGLSFQCTGCGKCCTGSPGYVFLSQSDIAKLAAHKNMTPALFCRTYTRLVNGDHALLDRLSSDCVFLENQQCTVYEARPTQCKTFPWWVENLQTPESWIEASRHCEGIGQLEAPLFSQVEIEEQCATYLDNLIEQNFSL
jgi:Fe-S-cluster containining protein